MSADTITGAELRAWRKKQDLTQAEAAGAFERSTRQWIDYEKGAVQVPAAIAERVLGKPMEVVQADRAAIALAEIERVEEGRERPPGKPYAHPLIPAGTTVYLEEDWPFDRYPVSLPKGRWRIMLKAPIHFKNGAECTSIEFCSNGVGAPSSILIGHLKGAVALQGLEGVIPGSYKAARPHHGSNVEGESRLKGKPARPAA